MAGLQAGGEGSSIALAAGRFRGLDADSRRQAARRESKARPAPRRELAIEVDAKRLLGRGCGRSQGIDEHVARAIVEGERGVGVAAEERGIGNAADVLQGADGTAFAEQQPVAQRHERCPRHRGQHRLRESHPG